MRTTLTIEPDVAAAIARHRERTGDTLKKSVNDLLRAGINQATKASRGPEPPTLPVSAGRLLVPSLDNIAEVLAQIEGDDYK